MPNFRLWLFSIITCGSAFSVLAAMERCDMCTCHVDKNVLSLLNCSDIKTKPGDSFGTVRQPHPDTYSHYTFETIEAHFERNRIKTLARISPLRVSKLSLAYNEITAIDSGTFMKLRTLKTLSLHSNKIQAMHEKSFQDLSDLEILDLSQNVLTNLSTDTFIPLKSLRQLSLSHNLIESLKGKIFAISTLQKLDLSFNSINHIEGNIFENANKLITLNISNNNLSTIDNDMFESLASLETLDLSFNKIVIVESHALSHMKSLKWLSLSWNNLTKMPENTKLPADLHVLHLVGNALPELGSNIKNLRLEELYVQRNYLQTLDLNGSRLKMLNLSSNLLTSFPVTGYAALEVLDLSGNRLSTVPQGLTGLQMPALRWLSLDNNAMSHVRFPTAAKEEQDGEVFVNLTWVSVSHMKELEELEAGAFSGLASPCGMCRSGAEETGVEFEALAQNCSRRLTIRVAHNPRLVKINADAFKDVGICSLDLSHNALSFLDERVTQWDSLEAVDLQGNPWDCSCPLQWVLDRVVPHVYSTSQDLLYEFRCNTPIPLRNTRLVHFYKWKKAAFCSQMDQLRAASEPQDVNVTLGSSEAMLGVVAGLAALGIILVVVGIVLQRRFNRKLRARNRRN